MGQPCFTARNSIVTFELNNSLPPKRLRTLRNCGTPVAWYCTRTPPGNLKLSKTALAWSCLVPGMLSATVGKCAFLCALLCLCQSVQILSIKPWWSINSGDVAESNEHMWPPIRQWTVSCRLIRSEISNESKSTARVLKTSATATESGGLPVKLNCRRRQSPPADGTTFQVPRLKGPLVTHCSGVCSPFPPKPLFPIYQRSDARPSHGVWDTTLQSQ